MRMGAWDMTARLFLRPGRQDHKVVADLLTPGPGTRWLHGEPLLGGVVIDATIAESRPQLAEAAAGAGIAALVDPLTFFIQGEVDATDAFSRLPYGIASDHGADDIDLAWLVDTVVEFQMSSGATTLVAPYFHVTEAESSWGRLNLTLVERTAERCQALGVNLPAVAVLSGSRRTLSSRAGLEYIDSLLTRSRAVGVGAVGICASPAGKPNDSYDGVMRVATILGRAQAHDLPVIAWRQGAYGPALAALGAGGYECGLGAGETSDITAMQTRRRPRPVSGPKFSPRASVFLPAIGRSVKPDVAEVLLRDPRIQGELLCDLPGCCSSIEETLSDPRRHAARTRAFQLQELSDQPRRWRVQQQLRDTENAIGTARRANEVLSDAGHAYSVPARNLQAIADVLRFEGEQYGNSQSA